MGMPRTVCWIAFAVLFSSSISSCSAWDSEDLEVFDVVEEVGKNFYDLLEVPNNADAKAIKRAFRSKSLLLHPDKNPAPDAEIQFRNLVAVHDILKDPVKRAKYDDVLLNGLPDWRQAVFYYRRVRKMGLIEMSVILFIIVTIGQYCVAWAAYFEKKYAIEEFVKFKSKKIQKKQKKGKPVDETEARIIPELLDSLPRPSVKCTLPVQIFQLCWFLIVDAPPLTYCWIKTYFQERAQAANQPAEESSEEEEVVYVPRERGPRRRKGFQVPEVKETKDDIANGTKPKEQQSPKKSPPPPQYVGGLWTDDDFLDLIRLMKKFPPGSNERWEKIGQAMKRAPNEVAHMAHKMKDDGFKPVTKEEEPEVIPEVPKKVKTRSTIEVEESPWSASQQKALEAALAAHPKGSTGDRWARIASSVPGKTKEECIMRYKKLHEAVKKKKEETTECSLEEELAQS